MKILLFGNQGQVGRELEALAAVKGYHVFGYDIDSLNIADSAAVELVIMQHLPLDVVVNAAAYTAVDRAEAESDLAYAANRDGVGYIAAVCARQNIPFLHVSTDYVFDGEQESPYQETDLAAPLGVYGQSKLAGEELLAKLWVKHIILRVSGVFSKHGNNFVKTILRLASQQSSLKVVGDQHICPTSAADIARVLLELATKIKTKPSWGVYHYCGAPAISWYEFAAKIIELARHKHTLALQKLNKITTAEYSTKAKRPRNSELEVSKIIKDYAIKRHAWLDYLKEVI